MIVKMPKPCTSKRAGARPRCLPCARGESREGRRLEVVRINIEARATNRQGRINKTAASLVRTAIISGPPKRLRLRAPLHISTKTEAAGSRRRISHCAAVHRPWVAGRAPRGEQADACAGRLRSSS